MFFRGVLARPRGLVSMAMLAGAAVSALAEVPPSWGVVITPKEGDVLRSGQWAEVRWTALPPHVEEFEILLSLDDGASFALRLTPQLDPALGTYRWQVPNVPSKRARLRLRVGMDHREIEGPLGAPFEIVGDPSEAAAAAHWRDGEFWCVTLPQPPSPFQPKGVYVGLQQVQPGEELVALITESRVACQAELSSQGDGLDLSFPHPLGLRQAHDRRPRDLPLRR